MTPTGRNAFAVLRGLTRQRGPEERCDLCGAGLTPQHVHLIEPAGRRLHCCCDACAVLFDNPQNARYRLARPRVQHLPDFRLTDEQWDALRIPIDLAFFFRSSAEDRVVAVYPSPAGPIESLLTLEAWRRLEDANPVLRELAPDVEALLVHRVGRTREHFLASIDECYKLVGLIRTHWRGLSGGTELWREINGFFAGLSARADHA
ncbi:MAG TPA: DUF5947 family protein [Gemmataceae bacterium]|nr:DUF5947 family protein [Gemmataceae bacterium]